VWTRTAARNCIAQRRRTCCPRCDGPREMPGLVQYYCRGRRKDQKKHDELERSVPIGSSRSAQCRGCDRSNARIQ
jgi:hypothetical protein